MSYVVGLWQEGLIFLLIFSPILSFYFYWKFQRERAREEFQAASMDGILFLPPPTWTEYPGGWEIVVPISEQHSFHIHVPRRGQMWSDWNWVDPWPRGGVSAR